MGSCGTSRNPHIEGPMPPPRWGGLTRTGHALPSALGPPMLYRPSRLTRRSTCRVSTWVDRARTPSGAVDGPTESETRA